LNNSDSTTLMLSSIAIAVSILTILVNVIIKFFWDDDWKRFRNKIYKLIGKRSSGVYYGTRLGISYEKMLFADTEQCINLFYTICITFLEERKELFINNKINRKKLKMYVLNFKMVIKFLIDYSKNKITNNKLKTDILDYKFISCLSINTPDQWSDKDKENISIFQVSNSKRCEFQDIVRLKGLTFDEVIERLKSIMYLNIGVSTHNFLFSRIENILSFFNSEKECEKYSFKYFNNLFCKKFEKEVLDYEKEVLDYKKEVLDYQKKFSHEKILKTICVIHKEDRWVPVNNYMCSVQNSSKPYWNIDHYADEVYDKRFVMRDNKIYDKELEKDLNDIYEKRVEYKEKINNSKFYRELFGVIK
jgi:hypothetical protein